MPASNGLDRSTAFTIMLDIDPGFGKLDVRLGRERVTVFLSDWHRSTGTDMYRYAVEWVRTHPIEELA